MRIPTAREIKYLRKQTKLYNLVNTASGEEKDMVLQLFIGFATQKTLQKVYRALSIE
jgi:hypothetical protein